MAGIYNQITITIFLVATGEILGTQMGRDYHLIDPVDLDPTIDYLLGGYNGREYYVDILDSNTPKLKIAMGTTMDIPVNILNGLPVIDSPNPPQEYYINADGVDFCTIQGIPAGVTIEVFNQDALPDTYNITGDFEYDSEIPYRQAIHLTGLQYLPERYIINAT